jgi:amino acid adenylation domain-containing protein
MDSTAPQRSAAQHEPIHRMVRRAVESWPTRVAIEGPERSLTFAELAARSDDLALRLLDGGLNAGDRVAILAENPLEVIPAMLAVLQAGGVFVPLDPELPERRLAALVAEVSPQRFLVEPRFYGLLAGLPAGAAAARGALISLDGREPAAARSPVQVERSPDAPCYIVFTSGSTGRPKGIVGRFKAIDHYIRWEIALLGAGEGVRVSQLTTPAFDAFLRDVFVPLCAGGTVCLPPDRASRLDPGRLVSWLHEREVHLLHCVPSLLRSLLAERLKPELFPALRWVLLAGEPLLPADVRRFMEVFGERIELVNLYGPSETTMTKLFHRVRPADREAAAVPIGRAMEGARAVVVDEGGGICPPGGVGEILIRTPFRSLGYHGNPERTREVFVPNPLRDNPDDLVYKTGDLGRVRDDGEIEFLGRRDHQVKIRGIRVEPGEIEGALREHPQVRDAVVLACEGATGLYLCAYAAVEGEVAPAALRLFLEGSLPDALVPAAFVLLDRLPRTLTGKVDRAALPPPPPHEPRPYVAPRTPTEELLASLWQELLRCGRVGVHDNFFALSGHSLLALRLLSRIRDLFGVEVALGDFLSREDLAALAARVDELQRAGSGLPAPPLEPMPRDADVPLSFGQQRLWFLDQLDPGSSAYNLAMTTELGGDIDRRALEAALSRVTERHEVLRTIFVQRQGFPVQHVVPARPFALPLADLSGLAAALRDGESARLGAAETRAPFDLSRGPLLRGLLVRRGADEHGLFLTAHHTVIDDWSIGVMVRDLSAFYTELVTGEPAALPALPVQYADFALWQRGWLRDQAVEEQLAYWREHLRGALVLELPADHSRPPVLGSRGGRVRDVLPPSLAHAVAELNRGEGLTLFMTLLAAFTALLSRYSGQDDLVVGTPVANRGHSEIENLVGFFVNTLALRTDLADDPGLRQLATRIRQTALGAYSHQDLPFEKLVEDLQPRRDLSRHPLFQVMLVCQHEASPRLELPGLKTYSQPSEVPRANFDLTLGVLGGSYGLPAALDYNVELFEAVTAERLLGHFRELLTAAVAAPDVPISRLPLLSASELHQTLREWHGEPLELPPGVTLHGLFAARAALVPGDVAVVWEGGEMTYGELLSRSRAVADRLRALGVGPDQVVGLCLERSPRLFVGLLGILAAGGAYLPLDPALPPERLAWMLADSRALLVLAEERTLEAVPPGVPLVLDVEIDIEADIEANIETDIDAAPFAGGAGPGNLAYVLYTSGSSGQPKGVMVPHGGACSTLLWRLRDFGLTRSDRVLQNIPLTFDPSVWQIFGALLSGARLILVPPARHQDTLWLGRTMRDRGVTLTDFPPSLLQVLLETGALEESTALRCLFVGGEAFPPELKDRAIATLATDLYNIYGPTEACIDIACWNCRNEAGGERVPIGRPIAGKRVFLLDPTLEPVPIGLPGELYTGGDGLARGYAGRPDLTAEAFVPSPFAGAPGERLYRTGDLARFRPDGVLEFLGRTDRQVKVRGRRIELGEIEALLGRHPQVREVAVVVREDTPGDPRLVAYCTAREGEPAAAALAPFLRRRLPDSMVPSAFVVLAELPVTSNGKLDRAALPAPPAVARADRAAPVPPASGLEKAIADVWCEVLKVDAVGIDDDFFALGGHSLLLVLAQARLVEAVGREIPIVDLFACPTVRSLARHLAGPEGEESFAAEEERARLQLAARRRQKDRLRARETEVVS